VNKDFAKLKNLLSKWLSLFLRIYLSKYLREFCEYGPWLQANNFWRFEKNIYLKNESYFLTNCLSNNKKVVLWKELQLNDVLLNWFSLTSLEEYPRDALCQSETPRSDVADALENRSDVILGLFENYFVWLDFEITF
jgi:hypothetical protein